MLRGAGDTERTFLLPSSLKVSPFKRDRRDQRNKQTHIHIHIYTHTHIGGRPHGNQSRQNLKTGPCNGVPGWPEGVEECGPVHRPHQSRFPPLPSLARAQRQL